MIIPIPTTSFGTTAPNVKIIRQCSVLTEVSFMKPCNFNLHNVLALLLNSECC